MSAKDKGYVYVLSNPKMQGVVKIGYSIHGGTGRADKFYKNDTAVALPFELEFEIYVNNPEKLERAVHIRLSDWRTNPNREFFDVPVELAEQTITEEHIKLNNTEVCLYPNHLYLKDSWDVMESDVNEILVHMDEKPIDISDLNSVLGRFLYEKETLVKMALFHRGRFKLSQKTEGVH